MLFDAIAVKAVISLLIEKTKKSQVKWAYDSGLREYTLPFRGAALRLRLGSVRPFGSYPHSGAEVFLVLEENGEEELFPLANKWSLLDELEEAVLQQRTGGHNQLEEVVAQLKAS